MEKWWQGIIGLLLFIVGFVLGAGIVGRRTSGHIERLRHDLDILGRKLNQSKERVEQLTSDNRIARAELAQAQSDIDRARGSLDAIADGHRDTERSVTELYEIRDRIRGLIDKYGE